MFALRDGSDGLSSPGSRQREALETGVFAVACPHVQQHQSKQMLPSCLAQPLPPASVPGQA